MQATAQEEEKKDIILFTLLYECGINVAGDRAMFSSQYVLIGNSIHKYFLFETNRN